MREQQTSWLPKHGEPTSLAEAFVQETVRALADPVVFLVVLAILTMLAFAVVPT